MAADQPIKYNSQIEKDEHDDSANIGGKRTILYGWNSSTLQYERILSVGGILQSNATVVGDNIAQETGGNLASIKTDLDTIVTNTNKIISAPATSANQASMITSLASIDTKITAVNTGAVVVSSSALPTGAATSAKQDTGNTSVASIDTKTPALGQALAAASVPVVLTAAQITTLTPPATLPVTNVGTFATQETAPTTIYNGKKTVTTAGTRVTLASSQAIKSVTIKALVANTGTIYVGDGSVASTTGFALLAGESISLDIGNLVTVNLDSSVNGEGVTYLGVN